MSRNEKKKPTLTLKEKRRQKRESELEGLIKKRKR